MSAHFLLRMITKIRFKKFLRIREYLDEKLKDMWEWSYYLDMTWENYLPFSIAVFIQFTDFSSNEDPLGIVNLVLSVFIFVF